MPKFNLYLRKDRARADGKKPIYIVATSGRAYKIPLKLYTDKWNTKTNLPQNLHLKNHCLQILQQVENEYFNNGFNVDRFKQLATGDDKVHAFCRTGNRAIHLWALANAHSETLKYIENQCEKSNCNISAVKELMQEIEREKVWLGANI